MTKILIVGYGSIGKRHVKNLLKIPNTEIVICTKSKVKKSKRIVTYTTLAECIKTNPNVAFITNVTSSHITTSIELAKNGIDLFIEKPLSDSMNKVSTLSKLIQEKKLITMIGCNLRFHNGIKKIKKCIENKEIGKILSVYAENGSYLPNWHQNSNYKKNYAAQENLGGGVILTCIHEIDYLYWYFGMPKEVIAMTGKQSNLGINVEDLAVILLKFKNNIIAQIHLDFFQQPDHRSCKLLGNNGTILSKSCLNIVQLYNIKKSKWITKSKSKNDTYKEEIYHFLNCVKHRKQTLNPLQQGIDVLKIALAIKKSAKLNKAIKLE